MLDDTTATIWVFDLDARRVIRQLQLDPPAVDLAGQGGSVLVAVADRAQPLLRLAARRQPEPLAVPALALVGVAPDAVAARVAGDAAGHIWMLWRSPDGRSWAVPALDDRLAHPIGPFTGATDIELDGEGRIVVAGPPGADLRVFVPVDGVESEQPPLRARNSDGRGIVRTPDGRIGFWTAAGMRLAVAARLVYSATGQVDLFELDGRDYQRRWGRVFVDACIPDGTSVRVSFVTADEEPGPTSVDGPSVVRTVPANIDPADPRVPLAEPPLVSIDLAPRLSAADGQILHRREVGGDVPWAPPMVASDGSVLPFETYEGLVSAPPGRWLWMRLELTGTTALTPRIRAVRVEYPGSDWLGRLPRAYSADPDSADFLFRYLSLMDGELNDMDARAEQRDLVLDPFGAPVEMLPWVASLIGLTLDERWSDAARREMLAEAICLFRRRGTLGALTRMLEIYLGVAPVIVESWRLRGTGGAVVGGSDPSSAFATPAGLANSVVGFGMRVGGAVGDQDPTVLGGGSIDDAFTTHAHRFTVIIPRLLDDTQLQTVADLLDLHRPGAHPLRPVHGGRRHACGHGSARAAHLGGRPERRVARARGGGSVLGTDAVIGRPAQGLRPGGSRLGVDSRMDT